MVAIVSIGIESNNSTKRNLAEIPCAYNDALKIYNVFEDVLGNSLKKCSSVCVKNVTSLECRALISALSLSVEKEDIFIFYFSGHGLKDANGKLQLVFSDLSEDEQKGVISFQEIVLNLRKYHCPILIILDCCYSGAGIAESLVDDYKLESSISIITSTGSVGTEKINENGSDFTQALCKALSQILNQEEQISVKEIMSYTKKIYSNSNHVIGGGNADIVLRKTERMQYPEYFAQVFVNKMKHENYEMREALWYSVGYLPIEIKIDLLTNYLKENQDSCSELSWRVRRAIGSVYEYGNNEIIDNHILHLINSDNWMDKCVGYICARKSKDNKITDLMYNDIKNFNKNYPMDLLWLLVLYMSERQKNIEDDSIILKSKLMESSWGAMEIWKLYFNEYDTERKLELFKKNTNEKVYKQLCIELYYKGILENCEGIPEKVKEYIDFIKILYQCKTRGRIEASEKNKWIFSVLYGNWRDHVDLNNVFEKKLKTERNKTKFLKSLQYIPSVEIKMGILDYFSRVVKEEKKQIGVGDLGWALKDPHPWVVRTALPLFQNNKEIVEKSMRKSVDMRIYPGIFDLAIELSRQGFDACKYEINDINDFEKDMLNIAIKREHNV